MPFSIYDVKKVKELHDKDEVNENLKNGWRLLAVGFKTVSKNTASKVYILGNAN